ncbi:MAG: bifunctional DNA-formamidopyrimidine glycosylase/DNA-(apurinic or apyrimidinic site) lyase [Halomonadaceae bacterium]|nr:MAG: bifunctional DNA-formamidopyrimidine glycosylase/DNA-(apurinic or apyrimidinic site) lyase [Halomonadaceae bacterium]
MPELPEVETTRQGITPYLLGQRIEKLWLHNPSLRWPVPANLPDLMQGQTVTGVDRRAKYLLLHQGAGTALVHLGMSGSLRVSDASEPLRRHDHVELRLSSGHHLRFNDPRRFGAWLWSEDWPGHALIRELGPEPLGELFTGDYLYARARGRKTAIKAFIMNNHVVVGVGNIYASEALFMAGIDPARSAGRISRARLDALVVAIRQVLASAIAQGGTTLRDFINSDGNPGYFKQSLLVYGRQGEPCRQCQRPLQGRRIGQRSTVYCRHCQG